jgi:dynactin complex subunit
VLCVQSGILRFCGATEFASGMWAGIELDEAAGKNDGSVGNISYFKCPPKYGQLLFTTINDLLTTQIRSVTQQHLLLSFSLKFIAKKYLFVIDLWLIVARFSSCVQ